MELIINSLITNKIIKNIFIDGNILFFLKENKILIRYFQLLENNELEINKTAKNFYNKEKNRISNQKEIMRKINFILKDYKSDYILFKNYQHYPDMGEDIDIMIMNNFNEIKAKLKNYFNLTELKPTTYNRLAKKTMLLDQDGNFEIELHNKRLGRFSEFYFDQISITKFCEVRDGYFLPKIEFQFIINVIQRLYTRSYLRVSEILFFEKHYNKDFNWDLINELAKYFKIQRGVIFYRKIIKSLCLSTGSSTRFIYNDKYFNYNNTLFYIKIAYSLPIIIGNQFQLNRFQKIFK